MATPVATARQRIAITTPHFVVICQTIHGPRLARLIESEPAAREAVRVSGEPLARLRLAADDLARAEQNQLTRQGLGHAGLRGKDWDTRDALTRARRGKPLSSRPAAGRRCLSAAGRGKRRCIHWETPRAVARR